MTGFTRRSFVLTSLAVAGNASLAGRAIASDSPRPRRIFMVLPRADVGDAVGFQAYLDGTGMAVDYTRRVVGTDAAKISAAIEEIRRTKPDLVLSVFTPITQALAGHTGDKETPLGAIPLVFSSVTDPVASEVVPQLSGQGRNITGTRHIAPMATQLKIISSYREFKTLAIIYNSQEANMLATVAEMRKLAAEQGFTLIAKPVPVENGKPREDLLPKLVEQCAKEGADFLYLGPDSLVASKNSPVIAESALAHHLPTFCATELPIKTANILFGLVSRAYNVGGLAGHKAYQILAQGKRAQDIPVETLQRFSLVLRMSVATELKFYPPMLLLKMAEVNTDPLTAVRKTG